MDEKWEENEKEKEQRFLWILTDFYQVIFFEQKIEDSLSSSNSPKPILISFSVFFVIKFSRWLHEITLITTYKKHRKISLWVIKKLGYFSQFFLYKLKINFLHLKTDVVNIFYSHHTLCRFKIVSLNFKKKTLKISRHTSQPFLWLKDHGGCFNVFNCVSTHFHVEWKKFEEK